MPDPTFSTSHPDPDDGRDDPLRLPPALERLVEAAVSVRARTDQSKAPPLDDRARDLIRRATRKELPLEAAALVELNVIRYRSWAEVAVEESLRLLAEEGITGSGGGAGCP